MKQNDRQTDRQTDLLGSTGMRCQVPNNNNRRVRVEEKRERERERKREMEKEENKRSRQHRGLCRPTTYQGMVRKHPIGLRDLTG